MIESNLSRRDVLKGAAIGIGALAVSTLPSPVNAFFSEKKSIDEILEKAQAYRKAGNSAMENELLNEAEKTAGRDPKEISKVGHYYFNNYQYDKAETQFEKARGRLGVRTKYKTADNDQIDELEYMAIVSDILNTNLKIAVNKKIDRIESLLKYGKKPAAKFHLNLLFSETGKDEKASISSHLQWWVKVVGDENYFANSGNNIYNKLYDTQTDAYNNLARRNDAQAKKGFEEVLKYVPTFSEALWGLGATLKGEGKDKYDPAVEKFTAAVKYTPTFYRAWQDLGHIALKRRDFASARQFFTNAYRLNPRYETAIKGLKLLDSLGK